MVSSLTALVTAAVAQPLLDLIGRNAAFLVAHDATRADVVILAVTLTMLLPLLLAAVVLLVRALHRGAALLLQSGLVGVLVLLLVLVILRRAGDVFPGAVAVLFATAAGAGGALLYRRSGVARQTLGWLAVTAPVVAVLFLVGTPARTLVFGDAAEASARGLDADAPPIVVVVFDELPVASLLDARGGIDGEAFPSFSRLSDDATFFRNATGVAGQTSDAIPAALTGRYPRLDALPVAADHPSNLFSLLDDTYDLHVVEPLTELCPPGECRRRIGVVERYPPLLRDLGFVGAHAVLPLELARALPPVDQGWRDFRDEAADLGKEVAVRDRFRAAREDDPAAAFERFVDEVRSTPQPTLHFMHSLLPHRPWSYLADGRSYTTSRDAPGMELGRWLQEPTSVWHNYQRHLVQTQLADRLLGRLLDKLDAEGIYDEAVVVVMADHGISFTPGTSLRVLERGTFGEIAAVPLLVKRPGQRSPHISDRPVETIDVLPTVLDVLGARVPSALDGVSVLGHGPLRTTKRFHNPGGTLSFPAGGDEKWPVVERKQGLFTHDGPLPYPYSHAPEGLQAVLGTPTDVTAPVADDLSVRLDPPEQGVDSPTALISGSVELEATTAASRRPAALAVAVDGIVQAVTRPDAGDTGPLTFRVFMPPQALPRDLRAVAVYEVGPRGALTRIPVRG